MSRVRATAYAARIKGHNSIQLQTTGMAVNAKTKARGAITKGVRLIKRLPSVCLFRCRTLRAQILDSFQGADLFRGRNVILLGPNLEFNCELEARVKGADVCAVVNKGYRTKHAQRVAGIAKAFVVFHCMDQREDVGGGCIHVDELLKLGTKAIVAPVYDNETDDLCWRFHRTQGWRVPLFRVSRKKFDSWRSESGGFVPNTGFAAVRYILESQPKSVFVSGMSFMRTPYSSSAYDKKLASLEYVVKLIEKYKVHNPDHDFLLMREMYRRCLVEVDRDLASIFSRPYEPFFYLSEPALVAKEDKLDAGNGSGC